MTVDWRPDAASRAQIDAADPSGSVWLAANAGSGKTRVLTDRVGWLLLEGAAPERILCLTYTRAAAGEMQNRLFKRLGEWAMLPDAELRTQITRLGAARGTVPTEVLRRARTLFARAIETPGGLKVQTIHAFCASLLRRFPLEAGVSPAFSEMDETAAARLHADIFDEMAADPATRPLVDGIARHLTDGEPTDFLAAVARHGDRYGAPDEAELRARLGIGPEDAAEIRAEAAGEDALDIIESFIGDAEGTPGTTIDKLAARLKDARMADPDTRFDLLVGICLTADGVPRKTGGWPRAVQAGDHGPLVDLFTLLGERVAEARARIAMLDGLDRTLALHAFGPAFCARVEARKAARGWLDFDDQIGRARHLLSTSDMAQWVLFKLDGGLDHILVDEAQDTSPAQWDIVRRLVEEFGAGHGARPEIARTLFVVGDRKQSIYSFQGADPDALDAMRGRFNDLLAPGGPPLRDHALLHSFRSSPVILSLVDAVFDAGGGVGLPPEHVAFFEDRPGRVDLWPVVEKDLGDAPDRKWYEPVDMPARDDVEVVLAERVASAVETMLADGTAIGEGVARRPLRPGDVLILLQRRKALFHQIVRACKARGLDLAGADRLKLSDDMAVRDLIAALTWAAMPGDDLSLATLLRSPLCGLSEAALFALAHPRKGRLWNALRDAPEHEGVAWMLGDLLRIADILRPHEVLQRLLIRHDGRRRLLARLGGEAAEAIDALLAQALAYERLEVPSVTSFLGWLETTDVDVKRQAGAGSIRVMSVHGAKGLEAPVVILPETMKRDVRSLSGIQRLADGTPVWMPAKAAWAPAQAALAEAAAAAEAEERDRLLYVGMTRAENWLIAGAAGEVGEERKASWHRMLRAGMEARGAETHAFPWGDGLRLQAGDWSPAASSAVSGEMAERPAPDWLEAPVAAPSLTATRIAPSALPGAKALPGEAGRDAVAALGFGTAVHALLEHLPGLPSSDRADAARAILSRTAPLPTGDAAMALQEASAVLDAPEFAFLFAAETLAELPFALPGTPTRPAIFGTMDRVVIGPDRILVCDLKTNRTVPDAPDHVPEGLLRQMSAYRLAARAIWPDRAVETAILWTRAARLMRLPDDLVTGAGLGIDRGEPHA